jgi:MFS family permease
MSVLISIGALVALLIPKIDMGPIESKSKGFTWNDLFEKKALPIAFLASLIAFSYASVLSYLSIYAQEKGLLALASFFFVVFAAVMLITRPFTGRIFDEKGPAYILIPGFLFFFIGLFILSFVNSAGLFLIAGAFVGLGYGALVPSLQTLAIQSTTHQRSGYATATFFTLFDSGLAVGSYVLGIIAVQMGYRNVYMLSGLLVLVVLVLYVLSMQKRQS